MRLRGLEVAVACQRELEQAREAPEDGENAAAGRSLDARMSLCEYVDGLFAGQMERDGEFWYTKDFKILESIYDVFRNSVKIYTCYLR